MKLIKKLFAGFSALALLGTTTPTLFAQETDWASTIQNIQEASQTLPSAAVTGDVNINVTSEGEEFATAQFQVDGLYNIEPRFSASVNLLGQFNFSYEEYDSEGNVTGTSDIDESLDLHATILEGFLYFRKGSTWHVEDISEAEQEISEIIAQSFDPATAMMEVSTDEVLQFYEKYFDMTETDTDYVFSVKGNINPDEFIADFEAVTGVSIDEIQQQQTEETIATLEDQSGEPISEEERAMIEETSSNSFALGLAMIDNLTLTYNKDNYQLSGMYYDVTLTEAEIAEYLGDMAATDISSSFQLDFTMQLNFDQHGETFEITVPEGAPSPDQADVVQ